MINEIIHKDGQNIVTAFSSVRYLVEAVLGEESPDKAGAADVVAIEHLRSKKHGKLQNAAYKALRMNNPSRIVSFELTTNVDKFSWVSVVELKGPGGLLSFFVFSSSGQGDSVSEVVLRGVSDDEKSAENTSRSIPRRKGPLATTELLVTDHPITPKASASFVDILNKAVEKKERNEKERADKAAETRKMNARKREEEEKRKREEEEEKIANQAKARRGARRTAAIPLSQKKADMMEELLGEDRPRPEDRPHHEPTGSNKELLNTQKKRRSMSEW